MTVISITNDIMRACHADLQW